MARQSLTFLLPSYLWQVTFLLLINYNLGISYPTDMKIREQGEAKEILVRIHLFA